jgi:hypothetical protein
MCAAIKHEVVLWVYCFEFTIRVEFADYRLTKAVALAILHLPESDGSIEHK